MRSVMFPLMDIAIGGAAHMAREMITNVVELPSAIIAMESWSGLESQTSSSRV